jgi:Tfp pilus assembly protein PilF
MNLHSAGASVHENSSAVVQAFPYNKRFAIAVTTLLLILATMLMYNPAVRGNFLSYDDPGYVTMNSHVLQGLTRSSISWAFTSSAEGNWHPVTWLSHMADVDFFKLNPTGHHLTSVFLHVVNVALIFLLLYSLTSYLWRSALVAALFALHPLNVESVAWISERKNLLCTLFMILALWAYRSYVKKPGFWRNLVVAFFFALALMAKPMVVTFPFLLLLLDYWPLRRIAGPGSSEQSGLPSPVKFRKLVFEKALLFAMSAAAAVVTVYTQRADGTISTLESLPMRFRFENAIYSYFKYLVKGFWPAALSPFYPHPVGSLGLWRVPGAALLLVAITIVVWRYRQRRYLLTGWLWYLGAMVPVIGIVQTGRHAMADRYAYIPFLGLFILLVWLIADLARNSKGARPVLACVVVVVLAAYSCLGYRQAGYWKNNITLFSHALEVTPDNEVAETSLGAAYIEIGRPELALPHLITAVRLDPHSAKAHYWLANTLQVEGHPAEAVQEYQNVLRYPSEKIMQASVHNNLGVIFLRSGYLPQARSEFSLAISLNPLEQTSFIGRGSIEFQQRDLNAARDDYSRAAQISPSPVAFYWLGRTFEDQGDPTSAFMAYRAALHLAEMPEARSRFDALRLQLNN